MLSFIMCYILSYASNVVQHDNNTRSSFYETREELKNNDQILAYFDNSFDSSSPTTLNMSI